MYALFYRTRYPKDGGEFREWKFSGFESDADKIATFIFDCEAENGKDSIRIFDMSGEAAVIVEAGTVRERHTADRINEARK